MIQRLPPPPPPSPEKTILKRPSLIRVKGLRVKVSKMNFFVKSDALCDLVQFAQLKNVKNTHGGMLLLARLQAEATLMVPNRAKRYK